MVSMNESDKPDIETGPRWADYPEEDSLPDVIFGIRIVSLDAETSKAKMSEETPVWYPVSNKKRKTQFNKEIEKPSTDVENQPTRLKL